MWYRCLKHGSYNVDNKVSRFHVHCPYCEYEHRDHKLVIGEAAELDGLDELPEIPADEKGETMTESAPCRHCVNGITADRAWPVYCDCLAGLEAEMTALTDRLNEVTETWLSMTVAQSNAGERKILQDYCEFLKHWHDALEAEYERRRTNE